MTRPAPNPDTRRPGIEDFDAHDGLMPASLRPLFVPSGDVRDGERETDEPPAAVQALAVLALMALPFWLGVMGVPA